MPEWPGPGGLRGAPPIKKQSPQSARSVSARPEFAPGRVRLIQVKDGKMPVSVACLLQKRWLGENSMSVIEHTEQPLGKYVFALVMGVAYVLAAVAIVYPFYMYLR